MSNSTQNETHNVCNERLAREGGQARCCDCDPHEGCTLGMKTTQNDWGLAKIIKIDIEEVPEGYIRPYISVVKRKHPLKAYIFVEDMLPTQEETFTREEYPLIMFGFSDKYRQGFYVKKEFQAMFESLFKEFMELEYERGKADARKEVMMEVRDAVSKLKIITPEIEPPKNKLTQNQIFSTGQMNMLVRLHDALATLKEGTV